MKKKVGIIASSVATIAVCSSMIVGSTFALFTSEDKVDVAITSGNVEVVAEVVEESLELSSMGVVQEKTWENGGTAGFNDESVFTLNNITPGDKAEFDIKITDNSTVNVKYRLNYAVNDGYLLASGLEVSVDGVDVSGKQTYYSVWSTLENVEKSVSVSVYLPEEAGNLYKNLTTNISFGVEAVQSNGITSAGVAGSTDLPDYSEAVAAMEKGKVVVADKENSLGEVLKTAQEGSYIVLAGDMDLTAVPSDVNNVVIDANGYAIKSTSTGALLNIDGESVTFKNAVFTKGESTAWGVYSKNKLVNYYNCTFIDIAPYVDGNADMIIDGCTFYETLQFCFGETTGDRTLPNNLVITNNTFIVNNTDENAHGIVFNGGENEEWEIYHKTGHKKSIVFEGNTFNPVYKDRSYVAYYITIGEDGTLIKGDADKGNADLNVGEPTGKIRTFPNNTYNGYANYSVNNIDNQYNLATAMGELDLTNEFALNIFCPDCYNGKVSKPHSEHSITDMLEIENGVASVIKEGAWLGYNNLAWDKNYYVLSYDVDASSLNNGEWVGYDSGETVGWADLQLSVKNEDGTYNVYKVCTAAPTEANKLGEISFAFSVTYTYKKVGNTLEMQMVVTDGTNTYTVDKTTNFANNGLCWDVYLVSGNNEGAYAKLSNFKFIAKTVEG